MRGGGGGGGGWCQWLPFPCVCLSNWRVPVRTNPAGHVFLAAAEAKRTHTSQLTAHRQVTHTHTSQAGCTRTHTHTHTHAHIPPHTSQAGNTHTHTHTHACCRLTLRIKE